MSDYLYEIVAIPRVKTLFESTVKEIVEKNSDYTKIVFKYNFKYYLQGRVAIKLCREDRYWKDKFIISEFPNNCGWLVVHKLYMVEPNLVIKIATEICKKFDYGGFFISDNIENDGFSEYAKAGKIILEEENPHSKNTIALVYISVKGEK